MANVIAETDDDNFPYEGKYLQNISCMIDAEIIQDQGWINIYKFFTDIRVWPRGFPLEYVNESFLFSNLQPKQPISSPVQQFLANRNPDVDAIYRLTNEVNIVFKDRWIALSKNSYCPFNSQNTIWFPEAYPLLYLPSFVSFRMTDIWRSLVAIRCLHAQNLFITFGPATMFQERNTHNLLNDFKEEIPGYFYNNMIMQNLEKLSLSSTNMLSNLYKCYESLVKADFIPKQELHLVKLWISEIEAFL